MLFVRSKNDLPNNFKGVYKREKFVQGAYGFQSIYFDLLNLLDEHERNFLSAFIKSDSSVNGFSSGFYTQHPTTQDYWYITFTFQNSFRYEFRNKSYTSRIQKIHNEQ